MKHMAPVTLDFRASPASVSRLGKSLAVCGVLAMLACGLGFGWLVIGNYEHEQTLKQGRAELRRQQDAGLAAVAVDPDGDIARRLTIPWQKLFLAIESASDPRIALLEIRPDPGRSLVRLSGEAANLDEVLEYLQKLQKLPELKRPHLVSHAIIPNSGGNVVLRFIIQAEWAGT